MEATALLQEKYVGGSHQSRSNGGGKKCLNVVYILKVKINIFLRVWIRGVQRKRLNDDL